MGLDIACLGLLAVARANGADFSRVATIGRQSMVVFNDEIADFFRARGRLDLAAQWAQRPQEKFCEPLLHEAFGAGEVRSFDASSYEQASVVHDMNTPLNVTEKFSVVADFGTLEHVFNVATAFDNVAKLSAIGGHILHVLPGNNLAGHGFYQYSPEFFFQVYSPQRGYADTRLFASVAGDDRHWYEVKSPAVLQRRVNLTSRRPFYLLMLTRKVADTQPLCEAPVQQSDYVALWNSTTPKRPPRRRSILRERIRAVFAGPRSDRKAAKSDVRRARPDVTRWRVLDLAPRF